MIENIKVEFRAKPKHRFYVVPVITQVGEQEFSCEILCRVPGKRRIKDRIDRILKTWYSDEVERQDDCYMFFYGEIAVSAGTPREISQVHYEFLAQNNYMTEL
jgi:hypothetical protein